MKKLRWVIEKLEFVQHINEVIKSILSIRLALWHFAKLRVSGISHEKNWLNRMQKFNIIPDM